MDRASLKTGSLFPTGDYKLEAGLMHSNGEYLANILVVGKLETPNNDTFGNNISNCSKVYCSSQSFKFFRVFKPNNDFLIF